MATPPDELFRSQERDLLLYTDKRTADFLKLLERARKDLYEAIGGPDSYTSQRLLKIIAQVDEIGLQLQADLLKQDNTAEPLAKMVQSHLQASIPAVSGVEVSIGFDILNTEVLRKFSENELVHIADIFSSQKQQIKSILFSQVGVRGRNPQQVARELAGKEGAFAGKYGHIETILRTETSTVYNAQSVQGIQYANEEYKLDLKKRVVETLDAKRNHPISVVLNNQVQEVGKKFRVKVSDVQAAAARMKKGKGTSGIFWPIVDGYFEGERLPAHYRERGIMVPTQKPVNAPPQPK